MQRNKRRYGNVIPLLISVVDLLLLNTLYYAVFGCLYDGGTMLTFTSMVLLNVAYLVTIYYRSPLLEFRVVYADRNAIRTVKCVVLHAALFLLAYLFVCKTEILWRPVGVFYGALLVTLGVWWFVAQRILRYFRSRGSNYRNVVVVGGGELSRKLIQALVNDKGYGYRVLAVFSESPSSSELSGVPVVGGVDALEAYVQDNPVDDLFFVGGEVPSEMVARVTRVTDLAGIKFYFVPALGDAVMRQMRVTSAGTVPVLVIQPGPLSNPVNAAMKRAFDLAVSSVAMLLSPLVLIPVAIAVKLSSPGPTFFRQVRTGYRGREFICYKFRSMRVNEQADTVQATEHDARKTAVGNFLRKTNIDELPQFYNVFKGDMSLVGPRPHMVAHTEMYSALIDKYMLRHTIKPGITGWAQVNGYRGQTDELWKMEKRVEYDVWYAEHWNFMLDLKIMLLTVVNMFRGEKNAF